MINKKLLLLSLVVFVLALGFRAWSLATLPPSPYWEEAALGYDAYSILKTGKDHHGNPWPAVAFESFGDYKPSLYFYAIVPFLWVFDLSASAVRAPSALFGALTVVEVFGLAYLLSKKRLSVAFAAGLIMAIAPWHLLVSRVGFETNLALFLTTSGILCSLIGKQRVRNSGHKNWWWVMAAAAFGLSLYAYHASRVFAGLFILGLGAIWWQTVKENWRQVLLPGLVFILLSLPILLKLNSPEIRQRFAETSAFAVTQPVLMSNQAIARDGGGFVARLVHHRYWYYGRIFAGNYFSHFEPEFLFINGDINPRHSTGFTGQLYLVMLPLLVLGIYRIFAKKQWEWLVVLLWLLLAPVPAGLTKAVPHALRSLNLVVPLVLLTANGLPVVAEWFKKTYLRYLIYLVVAGVFLFEFLRFWGFYTQFYPGLHSREWQYGYKQMVEFVSGNRIGYDAVFVTRELGRPAMYYWFYTKTDPRLVQEWEAKSAQDQGEFLQFENIYFGGLPGDMSAQKQIDDKLLVVELFPNGAPASGSAILVTQFLDGKTGFVIYEK